MDLRQFKPIHGWRAFAGEVGVVVLGVLLALGAQQAVEDWQMRQDVTVFRQTIDEEIAKDLWAYQIRAAQIPCINRRIDRLRKWIDRTPVGQPVALEPNPTPLMFSLYRSAWDNRDANVFAALPIRVRAKYAEFYDELANNEFQSRNERATWLSLDPYYLRAPITVGDQRKLFAAARSAQGLNDVIGNNMDVSMAIGRALGVKPARPEGIEAYHPEDAVRCLDMKDAAN